MSCDGAGGGGAARFIGFDVMIDSATMGPSPRGKDTFVDAVILSMPPPTISTTRALLRLLRSVLKRSRLPDTFRFCALLVVDGPVAPPPEGR